MKGALLVVCAAVACHMLMASALASSAKDEDGANVLQGVLKMLARMQNELIAEAEVERKAYVKFADMCGDRSIGLQHEVKVAKKQMEVLKATVNKAQDEESQHSVKIEEMVASVSSGEEDLKQGAAIREKENAEFVKNQKDLSETIETMERAIGILKKQYKTQMNLAQISPEMVAVQQQRAADLAQALSTIVDASFIDLADGQGLASLIQTSQADTSDSDAKDFDAYAAKTSGDPRDPARTGILDLLDSLIAKAKAQLKGARNAETAQVSNYEMFKASKERKIKADTVRKTNAEKGKSEAAQTRSTAQGKLAKTKKEVKDDFKSLGALHHQCKSESTGFEDKNKARDRELKTLAIAVKALEEITGTKKKAAYAQVSFLQTRSKQSFEADSLSPVFQAVKMVRQLANSENMPILAQLVDKMDSTVHNGVIAGADPFKKVKSMLNTILAKLTKEMEAAATKKDMCDKEIADTKLSKEVATGKVQKLTTRIDTETSASMNLKKEMNELQKEVLANVNTQNKMTDVRKDEKASYDKSKLKTEQGIEGLKKALKALRGMYGSSLLQSDSSKPHGGGANIISILEMVEADYTTNLAKIISAEEESIKSYKEETKANALAKTTKEHDYTGKSRENSMLKKTIAEYTTDRDGVQTELDAINEYWGKIQQDCIAKPDPYAVRRARSEKTIKGLTEAAKVLEGNAVLLQQTPDGGLRGSDSADVEDLNVSV